MTDEQEPIRVSNYKDLADHLDRVENTVFWKSAGLPQYEAAMSDHSNHSTPDGDLSAGLAHMVSPDLLSVRVSIVVSIDEIYARADTATEYFWKTPLDIDKEAVAAFLDNDGVQRALATTAAHLVDAGSSVGFNLENPSVRLERGLRRLAAEKANEDTPESEEE